MNKCIDNNNKCYYMKLDECNRCNNKDNFKNGECTRNKMSFCTCRLCGEAVRANGKKYNL